MNGWGILNMGEKMEVVKIVVWQAEDSWLGYLQEFPDCWAQGESRDDLKDHLRELHTELCSGEIPGIRRLEDLVVS